MPELTGRDEIEEALDRLEYVYEVVPPEVQDNVETLSGCCVINSRKAR